MLLLKEGWVRWVSSLPRGSGSTARRKKICTRRSAQMRLHLHTKKVAPIHPYLPGVARVDTLCPFWGQSANPQKWFWGRFTNHENQGVTAPQWGRTRFANRPQNLLGGSRTVPKTLFGSRTSPRTKKVRELGSRTSPEPWVPAVAL